MSKQEIDILFGGLAGNFPAFRKAGEVGESRDGLQFRLTAEKTAGAGGLKVGEFASSADPVALGAGGGGEKGLLGFGKDGERIDAVEFPLGVKELVDDELLDKIGRTGVAEEIGGAGVVAILLGWGDNRAVAVFEIGQFHSEFLYFGDSTAKWRKVPFCFWYWST